MASIEGQAVGQDLCIPAAQPLNPHTRAPQGGCRGLDAKSGGLVQEHSDVAGSHQKLLLDLLPGDDLDAKRLILDATSRARGEDHDLLALDRLLVQLDEKGHVRRRKDGQGDLRFGVPDSGHPKQVIARRQEDHRRPRRIGHGAPASR